MSRSIAYQSLCISEIQALVLSSLTHQDCTNVGITCTALYDQAMDVVWADVKSLIPFMLCMPRESISLVRRTHQLHTVVHIGFTRELDSTDWQHFCKHTHRVKKYTDETFFTCSYPLLFQYEATPNTIQTISQFIRQHGTKYGVRRFFSGVQSLKISTHPMARQWVPDYLPYISGHMLQSLTFEMCRCSPYKETYSPSSVRCDWSQFVPAMCSAWPNVRSIVYYSNIYLRRVESTPSLCWLKRFPLLETLEARIDLTPSLILELSALPRLHTLKLFNIDHDPTGTLSQLASPCFPSLVKLHLRCWKHSASILLLQALENCGTLTHIEMQCFNEPNDPHSTRALSLLLRHISHIFQLTTLRFKVHDMFGWRQDIEAYMPFPAELLSTLFSLRCIRDFRLEGWFDFSTIGDEHLRLVAAAWLCLEVFSLCSNFDYSAPRATLTGVQTLYNTCLRLKEIRMTASCTLSYVGDPYDAILNASATDLEQEREATTRLNLSLDNSNISTPRCLALIICLIFPALQDYKPHFSWALHREWGIKVKKYWEEYKYMKKAHLRALLRRTPPFEGWELADGDLSEPMRFA